MRRDTRKGLTANAERRFRLSGKAIQEVRLQVEWLYTEVNSNDPTQGPRSVGWGSGSDGQLPPLVNDDGGYGKSLSRYAPGTPGSATMIPASQKACNELAFTAYL